MICSPSELLKRLTLPTTNKVELGSDGFKRVLTATRLITKWNEAAGRDRAFIRFRDADDAGARPTISFRSAGASRRPERGGGADDGAAGGDEIGAGFLLPAMLPTTTVPGTDVAGFSSFGDSIGHVTLILTSRMHDTRE